ncbi:MAG: C4-dicarboxylate transporter DctA [Acidobacteria bacterium RIFCSPLOWO2_02_FULL_68_18]|nr:MAG: C4-dicarboxylate transporter DctA [Acidobacteria bacterium RIFCSPLOWO2_02_FULL_68_18]OFW49887.1 MAG: C4-dicarboxylate transporter DctA [Acidobacteria bacterium RIFCSPLOWO2_12_FULL_68_19]
MSEAARKPLYTHLYLQVLTGITIGVLLGYLWPATGAAMRPLGDGFIRLIRMIIAPIIFGTVVVGIARMGDMKNVGRIGVRALLYFEIVSTVALLIGLVVINLYAPGVGINADPQTLDAKAVAAYTASAEHLSTVDFLMNVIPATVVDAFAKGEVLQVLLFSVLFGLALLHFGDKGRNLVGIIDEFTHALFGVVGIIMRLAPIGAFGAMAFTIGQYGIGTLFSLGKLMAGFYLTCLLFIIVVLGSIGAWAGFSIFRFIAFIKEELLIVLGTSSSESVLPRMMAKLEYLGCSKSVVGLVIPTGYSFNLDGTSIYMTMAAIFVAQATNTDLTLGQQLGVLAVLLLTSKGAAAVTGGGFVTLAATLATVPTIPVAGLALIIGIDRFMSEARALTNLIGNGVGTVVIAKWDGALDTRRMKRILSGQPVEETTEGSERMLVVES